jgi:hypothetical protein
MIGGDLIGENNFGLEQTYSVLAYGHKTGPIQSNNLEVNPLGIYNNLILVKLPQILQRN